MKDNSDPSENQWPGPDETSIRRKLLDNPGFGRHSLRMDFVAKLKTLMDARGWKQADLARASGVADSTVSHWLKRKIKGKPDLDTGLKLARAFGVPLDFLADDDADEPPGAMDPELAKIVDLAGSLTYPVAHARLLRLPDPEPTGRPWDAGVEVTKHRRPRGGGDVGEGRGNSAI